MLHKTHTGVTGNRFLKALVAAVILLGVSYPARAADPSAKSTAGKKPLKVIILAGQSNMQKPCNWQMLKGLADSPETKPLYDKLVDENGRVRVHKEVYEALFEKKRLSRWKSIDLPPRGNTLPNTFGGKVLGAVEEDAKKKGVKKAPGNFGPELGFGVTLYEELQEPILIIKTAWGGKSLHKDFRPPNTTEWVPPKGHPDHPDSVASKPPIPTSFEIPKDFQPPTEKRGKNIQVAQGRQCGKINGIYPIYVYGGYEHHGDLTDIPLQKGDFILGVNGQGLGPRPVQQWRNAWYIDVRKSDWKMTVTWWRPSPKLGPGKGTIRTTVFDTALTLKGGRAAIPAYLAEKKAARKKLLAEGGQYYAMMIQRIKTVLADPGKFHPAYDPKQGYKTSGFVWFHGFNDLIAGSVYPNSHLPRGYEQYSWILAHLIRDVRKELKEPKLPVVIGVFGQGGKLDKPHPLREAQVAVANYDEFKGNVVAVRTAPFSDARIPEIANRLNRVMAYNGDDPNHPFAKMQAEIKAVKETMGDPGKLKNRKDRSVLSAKIQQAILDIVQTPEEQAYVRNNISNQGYHYYGSPKFFVRAGEAFAKALSKLIK